MKLKKLKRLSNSKKILLICNAQNYEDSLSGCHEYNQVVTYFIKKELEKNGYECKAIGCQSWMGLKKRIKSYYADYEKHFDFNLFNEYDNFFFTGAIPLKSTHAGIIRHLKQHVKGFFAETNEYKRGAKGDVEFFFLPGEDSDNSICVGPLYDNDELFSEKQYDKLVIHIDHHFEGRNNCSDKIIEKIKELENNEYFKTHWNGLEIYYHSKKINNIDEIDFYNRPPDIPFKELAEIYRKTHIGFLSHRETLGLYPIEVSASGGHVVVLESTFLKPSMQHFLKTIPDQENFWNNLLPMITEEHAKRNTEKVSHCSYKEAVKKMLGHIGDIRGR